MIHTSMFQKHIHKEKFYPSADDFTQALLVMLVTNIMSVPTLLKLSNMSNWSIHQLCHCHCHHHFQQHHHNHQHQDFMYMQTRKNALQDAKIIMPYRVLHVFYLYHWACMIYLISLLASAISISISNFSRTKMDILPIVSFLVCAII